MEISRVDFQKSGAAKEFTESLTTTGFGTIYKHPISIELIEEAYRQWQTFFESSEPEKKQWLFDANTQDGYFPFRSENAKNSSQKDLKEFYHFYEWGKVPESVAAVTRQLYRELIKLGSQLLEWIDEEAPETIRRQFSCRLPAMIHQSPQHLFRIIHYPPLTGSEEAGAVRAAAHEDINLITLLPASTQMGLQVLDIKGRWHPVAGDWGEIVINVGDMLQMASQNHYRSTTHRVVNPSGAAAHQPRYSMPLFVHPRPDVQLSEKHTAESYLLERLQEIGLKEYRGP